MHNVFNELLVLLKIQNCFYLFKGAERKNKDESKSAERRLTKFMKQSPTQGTGGLCHQ